ncbi:PREDICTED: putative F-box/kelch-repeat protein At4g11750 [Camelina sativa]|uniref:F-box/kelch-repeat protein At4g11750 n=1 Tax=Camelina sativa TaxID=90675 RepID=A0ABM0URB4_CAMSA|nr:PREDICTED: putative F-box/kelch-repeat protein At4g11750 [Camelina sativa]
MDKEKPPVTVTVTETLLFLMLPNDLLFNCLARVSRLYYPTLSLVCKRFRSLLASLELYETRTLLGFTESCLYVGLPFSHEIQPRWFTLSRRPIQVTTNLKPTRWFAPCFGPFLTNKDKKKSSHQNRLVLVQSRNSPCLDNGLAAVSCNFYLVSDSSSKVMFMDCRSHTWHESSSSMRVARLNPKVTVLDGKIYVVGGTRCCKSSDWIECFDPKTHIWEHVPSPGADICKMNYLFKSLALDGKLYIYADLSRFVVYKPKENRWDRLGLQDVPWGGWALRPSCVIDNVLYGYGWSRKLRWYDMEGKCLRDIKGLRKLPKLPIPYYKVRLLNYGGKIAVWWEKNVRKEKMIWCVEIALEKRNKHEIYGKVEWCDVVLTVPISCDLLNSFVVTKSLDASRAVGVGLAPSEKIGD